MFSYCENNPVNYSDSTGLYRLIDGWIAPSKAQPPKPKPKHTEDNRKEFTQAEQNRKHFTTAIDAAINSIELTAGLGIGLGGSCEIAGFDITACDAHNYLEICFDNGEFNVRSSDTTKVDLAIPIFSMQYNKKNYGSIFDMNIYEGSAGKWSVTADLSLGVGGALYLGWLGGSFDIKFNFVEFIGYLSNNW